MGLLDNNNFRMSVDRNPYAQSPTMTPEEYKAAMIDANTPARFKPENKNRSFFSPSLVPGEGTYTDPYTGMQRKQGSNIDFLKTGDEIQTLRKEALAKEKAFAESGATVQSTLPDKGESLLPDAKITGKSFKDQLNSVADKIFNMQSNDPEGYRRMISGLDLYSRSQTQDFATAMIGNNKFNQDQANALMKSNMNAINFQMSVAKYDDALKKSKEINVDDNETLIAKSFLVGKVDKDNLDSYTAVIATLAKRESVKEGIPYEEVLPVLFSEMQRSGVLEDKSFFSSKLTLDPSKIGKVNVDGYDQEQFDALPKGTRFIRDGKENIK